MVPCSAKLATAAVFLASMVPALADGPAYEKDISTRAETTRHCHSGPFAGSYIGATAGLNWSSSDNTTATGPDTHTGTTHNSFTAGVLAGHNWQCGGFVYGIEGDVNFGGAKTTIAYSNAQLSSAGNWYTTLRGRLGVAEDDFMIYMTGGLALGGFDHDISAPSSGVQQSSSTTGFGYTLGAGAELNRGPWALRLEALYVDLGTTSHSYPVTNFASTTWTDSFWVGRLGVTVKIGGRD